MTWTGGLLLFTGAILFPVWLLVTGRRLRYRGRRVRGAFWGGIIGHLVGDLLFLGALLTPPLSLSRGQEPMFLLLLVVPAVFGVMIGAAVGRERVSRRAYRHSTSLPQ